MKPFQTLVATLLFQTILLSPSAMAKKDRPAETQKNKDKQEERQAESKKQAKAEPKQQQAKKENSKPEPAKRAAAKPQPKRDQPKPQPKKQQPKPQAKQQAKPREVQKPVAEKKRDQPKKDAKTKDMPTRKVVEKRPEPVKPVALPGKRPDADKKQTSPKNEDPKKKDGEKKAKADKPMPLPGKRHDVGKKGDIAKKDGPNQRDGEKKAKADKPMPLPGKRPGAGKKEVASSKDQPNKGADKKDVSDKKDRPDKNDRAQRGDKADPKAKSAKKDKQMDGPGRRPDVEKGDVGKKKTAGEKIGGKGKENAKRQDLKKKDSKQSAKKADKRAKRADLPGKRPKVSDSARTARTEQLRNKANKRQAEQRLLEAKSGKKARERREQVVRAGQNSRKIRRADVRNNTNNNNWWNTNNRVTNNRFTNNDVRIRNTRINNTTVINRNFERNVNWTTRKRDWGYNPWWNRQETRPWYGNSWNGRWNRDYYRSNYRRGYDNGYHDGYRPPGYSTTSAGAAIGWGLLGWSLGTMVYDTGYQRYQNPYPVSMPVSYGNTRIDYNQPITRLAVETAPEDATVVVANTERSESIIEHSQDAFRQRNYLVALELADKAIAESPGDGALHEYRALILFALGKYGDAAGVLNPVLASGPGWDWSTMIALYDSQQTYTDQLQRLEAYSEAHPDSADTHFLLGYHYMVCGHTDLATPQFDLAAKLMPSDSVSRQLAELTSASVDTDDDAAEAEVPSTEELDELPDPEPVPLDKLTGTWTSTRDDGSTVTLVFDDEGKFTWSYVHDGKTSAFAGDYSMNDDGLLVLDSEDSQMVANVALPQEQELTFVLAGGPPEDPGLDFKKG